MARRDDGLHVLLPVVADWFRATFGTPTPPQRRGWPAIAAGRHTLILAPTGSGKTLAAFLACLDHLWRHPRLAVSDRGVRVLYVSPLKALSQDIERNLQGPLEGIVSRASQSGHALPALRVAVRTGDTTTADRQKLVRRPPDILATTPESLHLMLTSRARQTLRSVSHVIVDEIHALCPNKRGVFLALLLERLQAQNDREIVRVGLSATQRPLDEVARYLGGLGLVPAPDGAGPGRLEPRSVEIIDTGQRKTLDLEVTIPDGGFGARVGASSDRSIWPSIERRLRDWIDAHRSTIVFANNRRVVERLTARLNELVGTEHATEPERESVRAHHGSLSPERRRATEQALKAGALPAVVATASLELGIDMGDVDLVCQVESPGSVARALQRVGRAGHVVDRASKGRMIAKTRSDLLETAALTRAMVRGEVESLRVPTNCLDVLAQQVVACVATDRWTVPELFDLVRRAYPYRDLTASAFESVLELVSGRFQVEALRDLRPRLSWDRLANRLHPLPGTSQLALVGGGTIPDTGQYPVYLGEGGPKLGTLDEEFVLERRLGETFTLGTSTWRIEAIAPDRLIVAKAEGQTALTPFWRGEDAPRTPELGRAVGVLARELSARRDDPDVLVWLQSECRLDRPAARALRDYVARQHAQAGAVPDDRTVLVEAFRDPAGEVGLAVLTPFGGKLHQPLKLALVALIRRRLGITPAALHADDGLIIRLPGTDDPPLNLLDGLTTEQAEALIRDELGDSALFGLRFRQNAGRALLMPRPDPSKRTPLWLQRLRAKDLLQVARQFDDFPIVVETVRECLNDDLDLPGLRAFLNAIQDGTIRVVTRQGEGPSPFASDLIFRFSATYLYEWDEPRRPDAVRRAATDAIDDALLAPLLDPRAIGQVDGRLRGVGQPPRTADEMAEWLRRVGDLSPSELSGPMPAFLKELEAQGRALTIALQGTNESRRWILSEEVPLYAMAFNRVSASQSGPPLQGGRAQRGDLASSDPRDGDQSASLPRGEGGPDWEGSSPGGATPTPTLPHRGGGSNPAPVRENEGAEGSTGRHEPALTTIVRRFLRTRALVGLDDLTARYPIEPALAVEILERWSLEGGLVRIDDDGAHPRWAERRNLAEVRRLSVALSRRESVAVRPEVFAHFLLLRQGVHPSSRRQGRSAVERTLEQLQGFAASSGMWETALLPRRVADYRPAWLDEALASGDWTWRAQGEGSGETRVAFASREFAGPWPDSDPVGDGLAKAEAQVLDHLRHRGASFVADIARATGLEPSRVRSLLDKLMRMGLVINDRFDPLRPGADRTAEALAAASSAAMARSPRLGRLRPSLRSLRSHHPEGRWSLVGASESDDEEAAALAWASVLLDRFGVLARETAALDTWAPPWRALATVLDRAEWRGEVRRGYFVEGLSGVQYALDETAEALARLAGAAEDREPVLIATVDPANLYGAGAPFDLPLLEGGTARLNRSATNFLVLSAGRPVLIVEASGARLTGLAAASEAQLRSALALLPTLAGPSRRILKVATYNRAPVLASPAVPWLAEVGFVRDYAGMTYYASGW